MGKKDITLKDYFSDSRRYADLINGSVFQGAQMIQADELQGVDTVQAKSDALVVLERTNDIAMKQTKDGSIFAVWVVANQEKVDYSMPVRVMMQEALAYDRQLKEIKRENRDKLRGRDFTEAGEFLSKVTKADRLYPVVTLVVYWGEDKWLGAKSLHDMICFGEDETLASALKRLIPEYPLHFLNLSEELDYQCFHSEIRTLFELYSRRNDKEAFCQYLNYDSKCMSIDEETTWTLAKMLNMDMRRLIKRQKERNGGDSYMMCKAIEDLIAEGKTEGKAEGMVKGDALRIIKSAESVMKNLKVEVVRACEIIGVTPEEYQRAKESSF